MTASGLTVHVSGLGVTASGLSVQVSGLTVHVSGLTVQASGLSVTVSGLFFLLLIHLADNHFYLPLHKRLKGLNLKALKAFKRKYDTKQHLATH